MLKAYLWVIICEIWVLIDWAFGSHVPTSERALDDMRWYDEI